jgi:nitrite reductase/ring-hydroxylating ferredoxin subunit
VTDPDYIKLAPTADCPLGRGKYLEVAGHELAIFHLDAPDRFIVVRNSCPHAGGNLAAGTVEGAVVTCPWHQWTFDLDRGSCPLSETVRLRQYDSKVIDGYVCARLE